MRPPAMHAAGPGSAELPLASVRDLLAIDPRRLRLVAGATGLDRPVRWAHVVDLVDPRPYLRGHEFVMTMGQALVDDKAIVEFVRALVESEASGLGLGIRPFLSETPERLLVACDAAGLPLVEIAEDFPFIAFTEELAERLAARRVANHRDDIRRDQRLLDILAAGQGLERMLGAIAESVGGTLAITDPFGSVETCVGRVDAATVQSHVEASLARMRARRQRTTEGAPPVELLPIKQASHLMGYLAWHDHASTSTATAVAILSSAVPILAVELTTRALERRREREVVGDLMGVIRSGLGESIILVDRIERAGLDANRVGVVVWKGGGHFEDHKVPASAIVGETSEMTWFVCSDPADLRDSSRERGVPCGIGSVVHLDQLRRSIAEAESACAIAARHGGFATWQDLASLPALLAQVPPGRLEPFTSQLIVPIAEYDARRGGELLSTMRAFVELDGSITRTASELHIHANTLRYRLERIKTLTGHDPLRFLDRVAFLTAFWAWDLGGRSMSKSEFLDDSPVDARIERAIR